MSKTPDQLLQRHNIMTIVAMIVNGILMAVYYALSNYHAMIALVLAMIYMWMWSSEVTSRLNFIKEATKLLEKVKEINGSGGR